MYDCSAKQHIPFLTLLTQRKPRKPVGTQRICAVCTFSLTLLESPRLRLVPLSLCTTPIPVVWLNRPWRSRIFPTAPMLSVTGRPRGYAWCGVFPWGSPPAPGRPFMSSRCKKILQTIRKAFNINDSGLSGRRYDAPTRFR